MKITVINCDGRPIEDKSFQLFSIIFNGIAKKIMKKGNRRLNIFIRMFIYIYRLIRALAPMYPDLLWL